QQHCRELIRQRLASASGHQHERVVPGHGHLDDLTLPRTKGVVAKAVLERPLDLIHHATSCSGYTVSEGWRMRHLEHVPYSIFFGRRAVAPARRRPGVPSDRHWHPPARARSAARARLAAYLAVPGV